MQAQLDPRFGRCNYFVIVNPQTMQFEAIQNVAAYATGGAGIQAAQTIANKGVNVVITGNIGPNAFDALSAAGIEIATLASGTVKDAVEKYRLGNLPTAQAFTVEGHYSAGRQRRRGCGHSEPPGQQTPEQSSQITYSGSRRGGE